MRDSCSPDMALLRRGSRRRDALPEALHALRLAWRALAGAAASAISAVWRGVWLRLDLRHRCAIRTGSAFELIKKNECFLHTFNRST